MKILFLFCSLLFILWFWSLMADSNACSGPILHKAPHATVGTTHLDPPVPVVNSAGVEGRRRIRRRRIE